MRFARYDRVKQVFLRAVEHSAESRAQYLDKECGSDRELRRDIEALLAAHHDSTALFAGRGIGLMGHPQPRGVGERFAPLQDGLARLFNTRIRRILAIAVTVALVLVLGYWVRTQARNMLLAQAGSALLAVVDGNATALSIALGHWKSESRAVFEQPAVTAAVHALLSTPNKEAWDRFASRINPFVGRPTLPLLLRDERIR
jgi:hypothetical protein